MLLAVPVGWVSKSRNSRCMAFLISIFKAHESYPKTPSQHAADFKMLEGLKEMKPWVSYKQIDCIRVDGASDEGPVHLEVQFL